MGVCTLSLGRAVATDLAPYAVPLWPIAKPLMYSGRELLSVLDQQYMPHWTVSSSNAWPSSAVAWSSGRWGDPATRLHQQHARHEALDTYTYTDTADKLLPAAT